MFYRDLSPVLTMFMTLHFWSEHFFSICLSLMILLDMHSSPTSQIFDIDDEIVQHDSNDDSSSASDSNPID